jgi:apolipoprotein N-acyltransferase
MPTLLSLLLCGITGGLTTFAIPPYPYWWLIILTIGTLAYCLHIQSTKKSIFLHAFIFGLGNFGTGVSWVYISIHEFGSAPVPLATFLTGIFVIGIAILFALPFIVLNFFQKNYWRLLVGFPLIWCLSEWLRTWVFTGFPWLFAGYSQLETPLVGWAPIGGVLFVSLLIVFTASVLCHLFLKQSSTTVKIFSSLIVIMFWAEGSSLKSVEWTQKVGSEISIGIVQPNVPLEEKWDPANRENIKQNLLELSELHWNKDWILWPEAALPEPYFRSKEFLEFVDLKAKNTNTSLITGALYDDFEKMTFFNSITGIGQAEGIYFKQRLVPFGEYVPLESWLRGLIDFFNLPNSFISTGDGNQSLIQSENINVGSSICYEIVYPALVAKNVKNAQVLVTISNDAWFGESIGPLQHFHMARMRAIETGRYVLRGTNNGVSAIINAKGEVVVESKQFIRTSIEGSFQAMEGNTPYIIWRDYFILSILFLLVLFLIYKNRSLKNINSLDSV